jgi:hypothetical protein
MGLAAGLLIVTFVAVVMLAVGTARAVRGPGWDGRDGEWWAEVPRGPEGNTAHTASTEVDAAE